MRVSHFAVVLAVLFGLATPLVCLALSKSGVPYQKCVFASQIDGTDDSYATAVPSPAGKADGTLLVFLHGLGQDFTEPFKVPPGVTIAQGLVKEYPGLTILSCNYGKKPSWGIKPAREDISNNIHAVMSGGSVSKIVLVGDSMGACSALVYACTAPKDIAEKIIGIVAAYPSADLEELHTITEAPLVKSSMEEAFGKKPSEDAAVYRQNSLESNLPFFPRHTRVSVISATENTVFPPKLQTDVARLLKNRDIPVKVIQVEGDLQAPPVKSVVEAMQFVMQ